MNKATQRRIYQIYKVNNDDTYRHGQYEYAIAYNTCASIHTWIIRRKRTIGYAGEYHWYMPLDTDIR